MDETQISITVKPIYIERLLYWIIIIVLAVLLIIAYVKDDCTTNSTTTKNVGQDTAQDTPTNPLPTQQADPKPVASCTDDLLNQDETDIDCGGDKCGACANNDGCIINADCESGNCSAGLCKAKSVAPTVVLSGKPELDITNVVTKKASNDNVKVTDITYKITNGLSEASDGYIVKIFVKNKDGTRCLNQQTLGTCDEPYTEFTAKSLDSGKSLTATYTISQYPYMGPYLVTDTGYDPKDNLKSKFQVVAFLYDDAGNQIDGKSVSDSYLVTP